MLKIGESITIECRTTAGQPFPFVSWRRLDGTSFSSRISIEEVSLAASFLTIRNAQKSDYGTYQCIGVNSIGTVTEIIKIEECKRDKLKYKREILGKILCFPKCCFQLFFYFRYPP